MSFLTGYVLGMTLNKSLNRSYHERDFEKEQLKIKCQELEQQIARLQKQLDIATKALDHCQGFDFVQYALKEIEEVK